MSLDDDRATVERLVDHLDSLAKAGFANKWLMPMVKATGWAGGLVISLWGLGMSPESAARLATGAWACVVVSVGFVAAVWMVTVEQAAQRLRGGR